MSPLALHGLQQFSPSETLPAILPLCHFYRHRDVQRSLVASHRGHYCSREVGSALNYCQSFPYPHFSVIFHLRSFIFLPSISFLSAYIKARSKRTMLPFNKDDLLYNSIHSHDHTWLPVTPVYIDVWAVPVTPVYIDVWVVPVTPVYVDVCVVSLFQSEMSWG